ncbi:hypothetical protein HYC85_028582 [Camellia sinensis]|uniref:Uncharacterized protein n=1 Tax=Camellia sinensis TaxID=4442 RepID=A0A7J7FWR6_CAMSI|nr:hypothetical protein HYC85_028582 [Camellia sinensis]
MLENQAQIKAKSIPVIRARVAIDQIHYIHHIHHKCRIIILERLAKAENSKG